MIYQDKSYGLVNEKEIDDIVYQAYRCSADPTKALIVKGDEITEVANLAAEWKKLSNPS